MNIFTIGTAAGYVKSMELNFKWNERKKDPLKLKEEDPRIAEFRKQTENARKQQAISSIEGKMKAGMKLTGSDMEYLRKYSPELYQKAVEIEKERKQYERELKQCKSKEEVEKLNRRKMARYLSEAKAIANNPNIPEGEKVKQLGYISMRVMAALDVYTDFKDSERYQRLPEKEEDERERNKSVEEIALEEKKLPEELKAEEENPMQALRDIFPEMSGQTDGSREHDMPGRDSAADAGGALTFLYNASGNPGTDLTPGSSPIPGAVLVEA